MNTEARLFLSTQGCSQPSENKEAAEVKKERERISKQEQRKENCFYYPVPLQGRKMSSLS